MSEPENGRPSALNRGPKRDKDPAQGSHEPRKVPPGKYPGFSKLPAKAGVYRCKLWPVTEKRDPGWADYKGVLQLTGSKASVLIWLHSDGSLGLRLEKIEERKGLSDGAKG
jgi:hypothetical protein